MHTELSNREIADRLRSALAESIDIADDRMERDASDPHAVVELVALRLLIESVIRTLDPEGGR